MTHPSGRDVRYPEIRQRLRSAVGWLCDPTFQERLWLRGERRSTGELGFEDTLLVVIDELDEHAWSREELVGDVLLDSQELDAFVDLERAILALVDVLGTRAPYLDVIRQPAWDVCVARAQVLRDLLGRTSG